MPSILGFLISLIYLICRNSSCGFFVYSSFTTSDSSEASFLLTTGTGITLYSQGQPKISLLSGLSNAVHLDYCYLSFSGNIAVYWTDTHENKIHRAFLIGSRLTNQEAIVHHGILSIQGLAVDWLSNNVYWLDSRSNYVEVCRWDGSMRTTLLTHVANSSSLVLDPIAGYLFWVSENISNQKKVTVIERCLLDGSQRDIIIVLDNYRSYPSSLSLYTKMQKLYWVDSQTGSLHSTDYNGQKHQVVGKSDKFSSVFSFVVTKESIFWTDKTRHILRKASSQLVNKTDILTITYPEMFDLKLFYPRPVQSGMIDVACGRGNGGCSHLCLRGSSHPTCKCPYGLQLKSNNKTCTDHGIVLSLVSPETTGYKITFMDITDTSKQIFPPLKIGSSQPLSYAIDSNEEVVYRIQNRNIIREYLNGSPTETILRMDYFEPQALALDYRHENLYVLSRRSSNRGLISVCQSSGNFLTHLHWENLWEPIHLTLDIVHLKLFWAHVQVVGNSTLRYILETSGLDGSHRKVIHQSSDPFHSMTSDSMSKQLCWVNTNENNIVCKAYDAVSLAHPFLHVTPNIPITVLWAHHGNLLYGNETGILQSLSLLTHDPMSEIVTGTLNLLSVFSFSKDPYTKKVENLDSLCLPFSSNQTTCHFEKVKPYITYVAGRESHTLPLCGSVDSVELFSHSVFQVAKGDSIDVMPRQNARYFWISEDGGIISSVRRDGKQLSRLFTSDDKLQGIAVDWLAGNLYWSVPSKGQIWVSNLNGQFPLVIYSDHASQPSILVVQPESGLLFWASCRHHCQINRSSLSGTDVQILFRDLLIVADLAVDEQFVYWSIPSLGLIERANLQGHNRETVAGPSEDFAPLSLAFTEGVLYWNDEHYEGGAILRQNGSELTVLKNDSNIVSLLLVLDHKVQGTNPCGLKNGGCSQLCLYAGHGENNTCFCSNGYLNTNKNECQDYSSFVILSNRNKVESVRLDDPFNPNPPLKTLKPSSDMNNLVALTYDSIQNRIFFNDLYQKPYLFSMHPNGSGFRSELPESKRVRHIEGLAFEALQGLIIWTETTYPSIWILSPNKSPQQIITLSANDKPRGIVVHQCTRQLFWTNWNPECPSIQTCKLGQCQKEHRTLLKTQLEHPNGLTLFKDRIYWTESSTRTRGYRIQSCRLDATHCQLHIQGRDSKPFDLLVLPSQQIIWTDFQNGFVCLADASVSNGCRPIRRGLEKPLGLTLVGPTSDCQWTNDDESESTEFFSYGCDNGLCDTNKTSEQFTASCNDSLQSGNEYNTFHRNLFIIASVVGVCLILVTVFCIYIIYNRRKQRHWWQVTNPVTKECYCKRQAPVSLNSMVNTSLLELDEVSGQKQDDEQHLIHS